MKSPREKQRTKGLSELTVSEAPVQGSLIPLPHPGVRGACSEGGGGCLPCDSQEAVL